MLSNFWQQGQSEFFLLSKTAEFYVYTHGEKIIPVKKLYGMEAETF